MSALKLLIGEALVEVGWFLDDPLGESHPAGKAPVPGTPVLLLTDLGIGGGGAAAAVAETRSSPRVLAAAGGPRAHRCSPLSPTRRIGGRPGLTNSIGMVFWDRRTTVSDVRAARRSPRMAR